MSVPFLRGNSGELPRKGNQKLLPLPLGNDRLQHPLHHLFRQVQNGCRILSWFLIRRAIRTPVLRTRKWTCRIGPRMNAPRNEGSHPEKTLSTGLESLGSKADRI